MIIKKAIPDQFQNVRAFYHAVIDGVGNSHDSVGWKKDIYPSPELLDRSIRAGELFVAAEGEAIIGAMILNHQYNDEYRKAPWLDSCGIAKAVDRVFGKGFLVCADSHGHIGADRGKHAAEQISEELHHRKAFCLARPADAQELAHLKMANKPSDCIICLLRFHQLL